MSRSVRKYTKEFKQEAVNLALKSQGINCTAKNLGMPAATLHTWIDRFKGSEANAPLNNKLSQSDITALLHENRNLHKQNAILKEEREILKKAAAYFAQHQK